jgi:hypothetical protein
MFSKSSAAPETLSIASDPGIPRPRLFKATRYPPETSEEQAMWNWWNAMDKMDPNFQWKMPIEFFGRVIDQLGEPVEGATVTLGWTTVVGPVPDPEITVLSGPNGGFELIGARGKRLVVRIFKEGYLPTRESWGSFEYAAFSDERFNVPDRRKPVVFRLQKLLAAEPMLKYVTNAEVPMGPSSTLLDVESGNLGYGDLEFSINAGARSGDMEPDFAITIKANAGAAFLVTDEEFMFKAPETGYGKFAVFTKSSSESNYNRVQPYRMYVKTRSGKYAAVAGEVTIREGRSDGWVGFHAVIYHNPSGSRNLEFDHRKWLNR